MTRGHGRRQTHFPFQIETKKLVSAAQFVCSLICLHTHGAMHRFKWTEFYKNINCCIFRCQSDRLKRKGLSFIKITAALAREDIRVMGHGDWQVFRSFIYQSPQFFCFCNITFHRRFEKLIKSDTNAFSLFSTIMVESAKLQCATLSLSHTHFYLFHSIYSSSFLLAVKKHEDMSVYN